MKVRFRPVQTWPRDASEPVVLLEAKDGERAANVSRAVADDGAAGLVTYGAGAPPEVLYAPDVPVFDDLLAIWLLGLPEPPAAHVTDALCEYARLCRRGHTPGHVGPDRSPDAVLDEIRREYDDLGDAGQRDAFLHRLDTFFTHLRRQLEAGADVAGGELFVGASAFQREMDLLARDRDLYLEDRARGAVWIGTVDGEGATSRDVDLLILEEPASTRFRDWARRDPESPSGTGFALLLVRWPGGQWILSADPAKRVKVGHLAHVFEAAERAKTGRDPAGPWYAGERHDGTLVAAPRAGSTLEKTDVLHVLKRALHLRRVPRTRGRPWSVLTAAAAAVAVLGVLWAFVGRDGSSGPDLDPNSAVLRPGGIGSLDDPGIRKRGLRARPAESRTLKRVGLYDEMHALIVGISTYEDSALDLPNAARDARAVRDVLHEEYGFGTDKIVELYDAQATRAAVIGKLVEYRDLGKHDALLVYWAGHGTTVATQEGEPPLGYLVPYDGVLAPDAKAAGLGISMVELRRLMTKVVGAKHKLVFVDACYGGLILTRGAEIKAPPATVSYLRQITREKVFQVLTAGTKGQQVLDAGLDGHSVFAGHVLRLLKGAGLFVTASTLAGEVRVRVSETAGEYYHVQTPTFRVLAGEGDFVFLRPEADAER